MSNFTKMALSASVILISGIVTGCTDESIKLFNHPHGDVILKSPEVVAYSGEHYWNVSATRSNGGDGATGNTNWDRFNIPSNITDEERASVKAALEAKVTGSRISEDIVFPWENYFLQDVVSAVDTDTPSKSYTFEAWNLGADCSPYWHHGEDYANYEEVSNNGQISHYYQDRTTTPQTRIDKTALMTDMNLGTYEQMRGKQFRWYVNCHEYLHWSEYIVVEVDGSYYICFDFACGFAENDKDGHTGRGNTQNDWDYNDWIIKISPAVGNGEAAPAVWGGAPSNPGQPEEGERPENPGIPGSDQDQTDLTRHVEVNLSVNDPLVSGDYISTHLSLHVRAVTDVDVFIPVPSIYYCQADDMEIVLSHKQEIFAYGDHDHSVSYSVGGETVTLKVAYEVDGIRVSTAGINENVINYCRENFGDGITFEVWSYFNETTTREMLKPYLDESTVSFTRVNNVNAYINAFNILDKDKPGGGHKNEWDCTVDIDDGQKGYFTDPEEGYHYNGSPYNQIYRKKE